MKLLIMIAFSLLVITVFGQDRPFSSDENGKLIYYEVVLLKDITKDTLTARATRFFRRSDKMLKVNSEETDTLIRASGKMVINKTALVLSHPSGEILYHFYAETKEGKYRFWLTDFNFIPYERDRYGNFVPSTTIGTPLERKPDKLNAGEWADYIKAAVTATNAFAGKFKDAMMNKVKVQPVAKITPVISTQKW